MRKNAEQPLHFHRRHACHHPTELLSARWIETTSAKIRRPKAQLTHTCTLINGTLRPRAISEGGPQRQCRHTHSHSIHRGHAHLDLLNHGHRNAIHSHSAHYHSQSTTYYYSQYTTTYYYSQYTTTHYYSQYTTKTNIVTNCIQCSATTHLHQPTPTSVRLLSLPHNQHQHSNVPPSRLHRVHTAPISSRSILTQVPPISS
jgi:hypothetical protein